MNERKQTRFARISHTGKHVVFRLKIQFVCLYTSRRTMVSIIVSRKLTLLFIRTNCVKSLVQHGIRYKSTKYDIEISQMFVKNYNIVNEYYERLTGIAEVRRIQTKVLEVERDFIDITKRRKLCQDQIDDLKNNAKQVREKLENLSRSSDSYLDLITTEHQLLKDQMSLDIQLTDLKEREQLALDNFSTLLRQSHEIERLRQDRSKHYQIISTFLTMIVGLIALMREKANSQKTLTDIQNSFGAILDVISTKVDKVIMMNNETASMLDASDKRFDIIESQLQKIEDNLNIESASTKSHYTIWMSYIPGLTTAYDWIYGRKLL